MTPAEIILHQLGGRRFTLMTGAKHFTVTENSLSFQLPRNHKGIHHVVIRLTPADLYDMEFWSTSKKTPPQTISGLYFDQLQSSFTEHTGLHTRL
jgi:hypothetical protein